MSSRSFRWPGWIVLTVLLSAWASRAAFGQDADIQLVIEPGDVGLGSPGHMRPGCWTPLRAKLTSRGQAVRQVVLQWVLRDTDGDFIVAEQPFTLSPTQSVQRQSRWLYAQPPVDTSPSSSWNVYVRDAESREVLASQAVGPVELVSLRENAIGIVGAGGSGMGLARYRNRDTQHEAIKFLRIDSLDALPDRWYGLSMLEALVWTKTGGDPEQMPRSSQQALREWVERGGHLVIVHPYVGDPWTRSSLRDLLPAVRMTPHPDQPMPEFMGMRSDLELLRLDYRVLTPLSDDEARQQGLRPGSEVSVLLSAAGPDGENRPLVVTHRYGFGRVTLVGADLTDPRVVSRGLPNTATFWRAVFGWRSPAYDQASIDRQRDSNFNPRMAPRDRRSDVMLVGRQVEGLIAMRETATPALLLAILLFVAYWLAAGPVGFAYLRNKGMLRHSWVAFVAVIGITSVIAWGGAYLLRPSRTTLRHFTVLDGDVSGNTVHAHSWAALFVPSHDAIEVTVSPDREGINPNVLGSAGLLPNLGSGGFPDPQRYLVEAGSPASAQLPFRSTSRQIEIDYMGELPAKHPWVAGEWVLPRPVDAGLREQPLPGAESVPLGSLVHRLPGPLTEVLLVYCPGDGREPMVHRLTDAWEPDEPLSLTVTQSWTPLVVNANMIQTRHFNQEGYLGQLIAALANIRMTEEEEALAPVVKVLPQDFVRRMEMLSFFSTLPPPDFRRDDLMLSAHSYVRPLGRSLDLSHLIATRQLLVIGHLQNASLPIPLSVDGEVVPSDGWTVVRAICPVAPATQRAASTTISSTSENR